MGVIASAGVGVAEKVCAFIMFISSAFMQSISAFVAQNYGAGEQERIRKGIRSAVAMVALFCALVSSAIFCLAKPLMQIFIEPEKTEIIAVGVQYLRIEGACYIGIGILFLLYGYYRAVNRPAMSVILTIASLGTRVLLAYILSAIPAIGVIGIWMAVPIGWALADMIGIIVYLRKRT